jgi:bacillithiol biosynthesis cysteine-adding enzyme BshC
MNNRLDLRLTTGLPRIYLDYILDFEKVRDFYRWDYREIDSVKEASVSCRPGLARRNELKDVLMKQNNSFLEDESVLKNIDKLCEGGCAIVTGQQIGLFCGPLYTLYKAATAIRLARELDRAGTGAHIPVFWMECEDHDILEVGQVNVIDGAHALRTLTAYDTPARRPTASYAVDERVLSVIDQLEAVFQDEPNINGVVHLLRDCYQPGIPLSQGFARLLGRLFEGRGLLIVDPTDTEFKRLTSSFYLGATRNWEELNRTMIGASGRLAKLGYELQIEVREERAPFFLMRNGERICASGMNDGLMLDDGTKLTRGDVESMAQRASESFSPSVSLRPLLQDHIFLTSVYVAGPGEISYFAQVAPAYDVLGLDMPVIFPRAQFTFVEPAVRRIMEKLGARPEEFAGNRKDVAEAFLRKAGAFLGLEAIEDAGSKQSEVFQDMSAKLLSARPEMAGPLNTYRRKTLYQLSRLEEKLKGLSRKKHETVARQVDSVCNHLFPSGKLQERVLNTAYGLVKFGLDFPERILSEIEPFDFSHKLLDF